MVELAIEKAKASCFGGKPYSDKFQIKYTTTVDFTVTASSLFGKRASKLFTLHPNDKIAVKAQVLRLSSCIAAFILASDNLFVGCTG